MKFTFLGSGSAFTMDNRQSNMILEDGGKILLIDCGTDIRHSLKQVGLNYKDIDSVYISHLHGDHIGGLEWLALNTYFSRIKLPTLYINRFLKTKLWNALASGLETLQGKPGDLTTFFNLGTVTKNGSFRWNNRQFQTVQTVHVMNGFEIVPSFGLLFNLNGKRVFLTTDTQFCPEQIKDFYYSADIIFQDCELATFKSGVHAHYEQLRTLEDDIKSKMWLYHYQDGALPEAVEHGFRGFVKKGHTFE